MIWLIVIYISLPLIFNVFIMESGKTYSSESRTSENITNVFRKMLEDKKAVQSYIRERGTLEGFEDETIIFAKPL